MNYAQLTLMVALGPWASAAAQSLPAPLAAALAENPGAIQRQAEDMILGHGTGGRIDRAGIVRMVALDRAAARARAFSSMIAADLDADGSITLQEAEVAASARSASGRSRLIRAVLAADSDSDSRVTAAELRAHAEGQALRALSPAREERLLAMLFFDTDGDGSVSLDEVSAATAPPGADGQGA